MTNPIFDTTVERDFGHSQSIFDEELSEMYKWLDLGGEEERINHTHKKKRKSSINNVDDFLDLGDDIVYKLNYLSEGDDLINDSILRWKDGNFHYYANSEIFHRRFLTLFINDILSGIKKIVPEMFKDDTGDNKIPKKYYRIYLNNIFGYITAVTNDVLSGKIRPEIMAEMIGISMYMRKTNHSKYRKLLKEGMTSIVNGCQFSPREGTRVAPDDELIYGIIRVAFMFSTGSFNFKEIPRFKKIKGMSINDDISEIIIRLGYAITDKKYRDRTPVYNAFKLSLPLIKTNIRDANDSLYFNVGIRSIYLVGYLCGDKQLREFITYLIND